MSAETSSEYGSAKSSPNEAVELSRSTSTDCSWTKFLVLIVESTPIRYGVGASRYSVSCSGTIGM